MNSPAIRVESKVRETIKVSGNVFILTVFAPAIAASARPGQFCSLRVSAGTSPLLRRPFSICEVDGSEISFLIQIAGEGTKILSEKKTGDTISILGPLGNGFDFDGDYDTAVIVAGGIGAAPFPFFLKQIPKQKKTVCFIGSRTKADMVSYRLPMAITATDDGSAGFHGNIIKCLEAHKDELDSSRIKIFACGPTPMLGALKEFCISNGYKCDVSTECAMACGFGICQGCAVEAADKEGYYLVCKDGPVFDINKINFGKS